MAQNLPQAFDPEAPVFPVSVAAQLADMHPQTLRGYDRLGLVVPKRSRGRGRRYSLKDVAKLRHIQHLSQGEGINLEGIRRILALEEQIDSLSGQVERLSDALQRLGETQEAARIFTAEPSGAVTTGGSGGSPGRRVPADAEVSDGGHTLRLMPSDEECVYQSGGSYSRPNGLGGPDAVMFMEGATKATVTMQGSGYSAVALGLIVATDFGDAPESYG